MLRVKTFVWSIVLCCLVAPFAGAHGGDRVPVPQDGDVLAAAWVPGELFVSHASLFDALPEARGVSIPGGQAMAAHDGVTLVVDIWSSGPHWFILAIDEEDERPTHLLGTPAVVRMHEAAAVAMGAAPPGKATRTGALAVFGSDASSAHAHGPAPSSSTTASFAGAKNAWIQWDGMGVGGEGRVGASVLDAHGDVALLRFSFPLTTIGDGLEAGELRHVVVASGAARSGVPDGPFLSELPATVADLRLYLGRAGESSAELGLVAEAVGGASDPLGGLIPLAGVGALTLASLLALRWERGFCEARILTRGPLPHEAPRARGVFRVAAVAALFLLPTIVVLEPVAAAPLSPTSERFLSEIFRGRDPCESQQRARNYNVSAIDLDIIYNRWGDHDPQGMMYVLDEDIPALRAERARLAPVLEGDQSVFPNGTEDSLMTPLVLRARVGECVEIRLKNRLDRIPPASPVDPLGGEQPHAVLPHAKGLPAAALGALPFEGPEPRRVSLHVHGLPIDPRNAGGDALGHNPDTTVGPEDTAVYRIRASYEGTFFFHDHADPTSAGVAAFPSLDAAFRGGTVHGLFGALVVEPPGATWTHPSTGANLRTGWKADINVPGRPSFREFVIFYHDPQIVARDDGEIQQPSTDHGLNYRVETLSHRLFDDLDRCPPDAAASNRGVNPCEDISLVYASNIHGDPGTPIPRAYIGDPTRVRLVHAGMEETHAHHLHGHRWRAIDGDPYSTRIDSQTLSPSETFTETLEAGAGGQGIAHAPGDYIFHCHLFPHLYGGMWSFFRVHDRKEADLKPLASNPTVPVPSESYRGFPHFMQERQTPGYRPLRAPQAVGLDPVTGIQVAAVGAPYADICPPHAPLRKYRLAAIELPIRYNQHGDHDPHARIFVLAEDADAILAGATPPQPPVLRIRQGECMTITLLNRLPVSDPAELAIKGFGKVSIHTHLLEYDVLGSDGTSTGWIPDQTIWQGEEITIRFFADRDLQTIVWHDHAAGLETAFKGVYGATLVEPPRSEWRDPRNGAPIYSMGSDASDGVYDSARDPVRGTYSELWRADIVGPRFQDFREFFTSVQDFADLRTPSGRPYRSQASDVDFADFGLMAFNLRSEPLWHRLGNGSAITNSTKDVFSSRLHGDPATNVWEAYAGDRTIVRLHQVAFEEIHSFQLSGHRWNFGYRDSTSPLISSQTIGISEAFNLYLDCGAGGCARSAGDHLYRGGGIDDVWAGAWGLFRVHEPGAPANLRPLPDAPWRKLAEPECARGAPVKAFDVVAMEKELVYNGYGDHDVNGRMFVLAHEEPLVRQGLLTPKPLTLRVNQGDCVKITLTNKLPAWSLPHAHMDAQPTAGFLADRTGPKPTSGNLLEQPVPAPSNHVSLHAHLLSSNVKTSGGGAVGKNPDTTVPPGGSRTYTFRADVPGLSTAFLEDLGDIVYNRHHGLFGAIIVLPKRMMAVDPVDGLPVKNSVSANIVTPWYMSQRPWRDVAIFNQNGLSLTHANGLPVPLPGAHSADVSPTDAVLLAQAGLRDFLPGAAVRALIRDVLPAPHGHFVDGSLEGIPFRASVHRRDGVLDDIAFERGGFAPTSTVSLDDGNATPLVGVLISLPLANGSSELQSTNAAGTATFFGTLARGATSSVGFPGDGGAIFPTWNDAERSMSLHVRASRADLPLAATAGQVGLAHLRSLGLPVGPLGLTEVDVTSDPWRVSARDAIRTYLLAIDPVTRQVVTLTMESYAVEFGPLTPVSSHNATRLAKAFVKERYGIDEDVLHVAKSHRGRWQVDLGAPGVATRIDIDGATGRILEMYHGAASSAPTPFTSGRVSVQIRGDDGAPLDGTPVEVVREGTVVATAALGHGGRFVIPDALTAGIRDGARLRVRLPTHGIEVPLALGPNGTLLAYMEGVGATSPVNMSEAIVAARGFLATLAPPGGALLDAMFGVAGVYHHPGAWYVDLASGASRVRIVIDDVTGVVSGARVAGWRVPHDDCSGEIPEHGGPHPTAIACRWSFASQDEEDQGLHAINYRSEPLEGRLNRVPDPSMVFSSRIHGENGVEVFRAHSGDDLTFHVIGANDKGRVTAFSVSGHSWPREPKPGLGDINQAQGGLGPGRAFLIRPVGGAGGGTEFDGDYLIQGAVQRLTAEAGEWAILRVMPDLDRSVRRLLDPLPVPPGAVVPVQTPIEELGGPPAGLVRIVLAPGPNGSAVLSLMGDPVLRPGSAVPVLVEVAGHPQLPVGEVQVLPSGVGDVNVTSALGGAIDARRGGSLVALVDVPTRGVTGGSGQLRFDVVTGVPGARSSMSVDAPFRVVAVEETPPPSSPTAPIVTLPSPSPLVSTPASSPPPGSTPRPTPTSSNAPVPITNDPLRPTAGPTDSPSATSTPPTAGEGISPTPMGLEVLVLAAVLASLLAIPRRRKP